MNPTNSQTPTPAPLAARPGSAIGYKSVTLLASENPNLAEYLGQLERQRDEKANLLHWAETLICNAVPMSHCSQEEWDAAVKKWRDAKHGVSPNSGMSDSQSQYPVANTPTKAEESQ